jgi:hypothetical protein
MSKLDDLQAGRARSGSCTTDAGTLEVAKTKCRLCPWQKSLGILGEDPLGEQMMGQLQAQVLLEKSQICHAPALVGMPETKICRGARDYQIAFFCAIGFLSEPTDQAWAAKMREVGDAESKE